ncbi:NlpC/P60 family protein [Streptomyces sp. NPDC047002]|uniref:NlpC/P60 family protein n=1 Tax=Streptomyces sp. NPDC047002 TaxID=3155475 RepID=UPI00345127A4
MDPVQHEPPRTRRAGGHRSQGRGPTGVSRRGLLAAAAGVAVLGAGGGYLWTRERAAAPDPAAGGVRPVAGTSPAAAAGSATFERLSGPPRTVARSAAGDVIATFTDGARSAVLTGASRTWREPRTTSAAVTSDAHVRLMPGAWSAGKEKTAWFKGWFPKTLASAEPDILDTAFQYGDGAPTRRTAKGLRYAGDAQFGPVVPGESEQSFHYHDEKSDFYDYLGIPWTFADGTRAQPESARLGDVDCSGFMRLVWGYRAGFPLHDTNTAGVGLPRRAFAIAAYAPGVLLIPDTQRRPTDISLLQPGDLVFFAINIGKPIAIDHCGLYLGLDDAGHSRFLSSRSQANGPTMGDLAGRATLDGGGFYAEGLRVARRL